MLSKKQRLNTELFNIVFKNGKNKKTAFFVVKYLVNELGFSRVSVVVSKKTEKTAAARHLLKRKFVAAIEKSTIISLGFDLIFLINKEVKNIKHEELLLTINELQLE